MERYCELANRTTQQLYKVSTPCIDDHHFKEDLKSVGEVKSMLSNCSEMLILGKYWKTCFLWSANKLAPSITQWSKAYDKRLNRLISYINHTCEYKQYCYVGNTAEQCSLGLFSRLRFCRRCLGFRIYFGWNTVRFSKSYICSDE